MGSHVEWQHLAFPKPSVSLQMLLHLGCCTLEVKAPRGNASGCGQEVGEGLSVLRRVSGQRLCRLSKSSCSVFRTCGIQKKARVPGHGRSTSSGVANHRGDPPGLPTWQLWDSEERTAWDSPAREISRDITIFFTEELCDLRCWCQHRYKCSSV